MAPRSKKPAPAENVDVDPVPADPAENVDVDPVPADPELPPSVRSGDAGPLVSMLQAELARIYPAFATLVLGEATFGEYTARAARAGLGRMGRPGRNGQLVTRQEVEQLAAVAPFDPTEGQ